MPDSLRETLQASLGAAYTLTSELGGGGMSRVFVAREEALGRDVVVKVLSSEVAEGLSDERFQREIRLAAMLQEPHIVPVLTAGVTTLGTPFYTMPFVRGASLRERVAEGRLPTGEALGILCDVAQALAYAHSHGVVHRDIKPENILLSSGTAVVTDFGIAKALQVSRTVDTGADDARGITRTGTSLGTPAYMAPEQAAGDPNTDQRADLYAWGVVAYELLTGRHPFSERTSPQELLRAHLTEVPAPFPADSNVPRAITAVVRQCLEKDPADRPASATALLQQMQATRVLVAERVVRPRELKRIITVLASMTLALGAAGLWWHGISRNTDTAAGPASPVMMAVLPFEHAGPADQQSFTDGLTDAVTSKLASLSSLLVIDRRSAATYRGTTKPAQQIGKELGVRYLLEGVVRWAKDGAGVWRARVTPTLVDTKAGTISWTGTPVDVTLDDPFTAQGSIATDVAQAMEVAVLPAERKQLERRFTDNPQAFAAYSRAKRIVSEFAEKRVTIPQEAVERAMREFEFAVALDSNFARAWSGLVAMHYSAAVNQYSDSSGLARSRKIIDLALRYAPTEPTLYINAALWAKVIDDMDSKAAELVSKALGLASNDASVLTTASYVFQLSNPDSSRALALRAAQLDPRSPNNLRRAAESSMETYRWLDARHFAEALVTLDSTDESGWEILIQLALIRGDSVALQTLHKAVMANVRNPSNYVTCGLSYGSKQLSAWYLGLSATQQRVTSLSDSVWYYDCKADAAWRVRGAAYAKVYADSLIALLSPSRLAGLASPLMSQNLTQLAFAYASVGDRTAALALVDRIIGNNRPSAGPDNLPTEFAAEEIAAVYAMTGDTASALRWLRVAVRQGITVGYLKMDPGLRSLQGTEVFARFVRQIDR